MIKSCTFQHIIFIQYLAVAS